MRQPEARATAATLLTMSRYGIGRDPRLNLDAMQDLARDYLELRKLVVEAYPGEHPTNGWRARAEKLNAWPGAEDGS